MARVSRQGAPLRLTAVRQGEELLASGFECLGGGGVPIRVFRDAYGLYFFCRDGRHYLRECVNEFEELEGMVKREGGKE